MKSQKELIKKHLEEFGYNDYFVSSVESYLKTQKASGNFYLALTQMLDEHGKQLQAENYNALLTSTNNFDRMIEVKNAEIEQLQAENERLKQYKDQRDNLLSANIEKSNNIEKAYSLWMEEKEAYEHRIAMLKKDLVSITKHQAEKESLRQAYNKVCGENERLKAELQKAEDYINELHGATANKKPLR